MTQVATRRSGTAAERPGRRHVATLIVGSGFAGLGAAIRLKKEGRDDFLVIERGSEVGCIVIQVILGFRGGYCGNGAVVCRCARCGSRSDW